MVWEPATADNVPPQLLTAPGESATTKPAGGEPGSTSFNPIPLNETPPVFWMVMVSCELAPATIGLGEKNLLTLAPGKLVREAAAGSTFVMVPFAATTAPTGMIFVRL